nr:unnamed protein product [Callosobruchus analis]
MQTDKTKEQKEIRNEYVWFILLMLQCKKVKNHSTELHHLSWNLSGISW